MANFGAVSAFILDSIVKATALLLLAFAVSLLMRRRSAAARHLMRVIVMGALLLLPFSALLLPAWHVYGIPQFARATVGPKAESAPAQPSQALPAASLVVRSSEIAPVHAVIPAQSAARLQARHAALPKAAPAAEMRLSATASAPKASRFTAAPAAFPPAFTFSWRMCLVLLWLAGAIVCAIRWSLGLARLSHLVRTSVPVRNPGWLAQSNAMAAAFGVRRNVTFLESKETEVPLTAGLVHPRIVLSPDWEEWLPARQQAVLNHELAHIKRCDVLTQALAELAAILYWFHPLVWLNVRAMRIERERACDDHVLAAGTRASEYAHELLDIVSALRRPTLSSALAMARRSQLEGRVMAVLNPSLRRGAVSRKAALTCAALAIVIVLPLAAMRPAQQSATPSLKTGSSQASTPAIAAHPKHASTTPASAAEAQPVVASTSPNQVGAEAPPAPEAPEPPEAMPVLAGQGAPSAPAAPAAPAPPASPVAPAAPAAPAAPPALGGDASFCGTSGRYHMSMESHNNSKSWTASWSADDCNVDLRAEGDVQFNADGTAIDSISSGGYFEVNERRGDTLRRVKVTPSGSGLQYVYKVNGKQQPFNTEAKAWFSNFLLELVRSTGFGADARIAKLLAKGGPTAVLDEINNLHGDYVRGLYFQKLLQHHDLPAPVVLRVINQSGRQIGSDYELARVLMEVGRQYSLSNEQERAAFLKAAGRLKSDYEHSRVLIELLKRPNISPAVLKLALNSAAGIKSDYEKSRILLSLLDQKSFNASYLDFYLKMVSSIHSDYEKSRDLMAPMRKYSLAPSQVNVIMEAASTISSDFEKSRLLVALVGERKFNESQMSNYLKVIDSIHSDYERSRDLMALVDHNKLSNPSLAKVLESAGRINSDYEKARVLTGVAGRYPMEGKLRESYMKAAKSIHSEYDRNRALSAVERKATL